MNVHLVGRCARARAGILAALLAIAVACVTSVNAKPAAADPLPLGTFKIQANDLTCVEQGAGIDHLLFMETCETLNLAQQFTYLPLVQQILTVSQLGNCLTVVGFEIQWRPCDVTKAQQRFERHGPDSFGRYWITSTGLGNLRTCLRGDSIVLRPEDPCIGLPADDALLFRFPLV